MIFRVIIGLVVVAVATLVRRKRRRSRRAAAENPPLITVRSDYRGLENLVYRVVIERGGPAHGATFNWSRDGERGAPRTSALVDTGTWISLENGIDVRFEGVLFAPGDFWTFPARSAADTVTMKARRRGTPAPRRAKTRR